MYNFFLSTGWSLTQFIGLMMVSEMGVNYKEENSFITSAIHQIWKGDEVAKTGPYASHGFCGVYGVFNFLYKRQSAQDRMTNKSYNINADFNSSYARKYWTRLPNGSWIITDENKKKYYQDLVRIGAQILNPSAEFVNSLDADDPIDWGNGT